MKVMVKGGALKVGKIRFNDSLSGWRRLIAAAAEAGESAVETTADYLYLRTKR